VHSEHYDDYSLARRRELQIKGSKTRTGFLDGDGPRPREVLPQLVGLLIPHVGSLVQIKPPQLKCLSFQPHSQTLQPSELCRLKEEFPIDRRTGVGMLKKLDTTVATLGGMHRNDTL
jgi:hypothetical protein